MSRVSDRPSRPTIPFDSEKLAREVEDAAEEDDDPLAGLELADPPSSHPRVIAQPTVRRAVGTTPPAGVRARTVTAHDPFTTSVLAEIARRAQTVESPPLRFDNVEAQADAEHDADDLTPTTTPEFHPR